MTELTRRPAGPDDFAFVLALTREGLGPYVEEIWGWDEAEQLAIQRRWFDRGGVEIVELDGAPVGYLKVTTLADHVFLDRIALVAEARSRGLGTRLVREVVETAAAGGLPVRLSVLSNNPARRLYERLGFRITLHEEPRILMEWRPEEDQAATR